MNWHLSLKLLSLLLLGQISFAQSFFFHTIKENITETFVWTGLANNNLWNDPGNWNGNAVPGPSDIAKFRAPPACAGAQCNAQINVPVSVGGIDIASGYTGTLTQNGGQNLTVGSGKFKMLGGTFVGGNTNINLNGDFELSGGNFTSTSASLKVDGQFLVTGTPTFSHNFGFVELFGDNGALFRNVSSVSSVVYNQFQIKAGNTQYNITGSIVVSSSLTLGSTYGDHDSTPRNLNGGTIEARGNVDVINFGYKGSTKILVNGTGNQTITAASTQYLPSLEINKTSGDLTFSGVIKVNTNYTHIAGNLITTGSTLVFRGDNYASTNSITPGTQTYNNVTFNGNNIHYSLTGNFLVNGTLTLGNTFASQYTSPRWITGGTIEARGNIVIDNFGYGGDTELLVNGTAAQSMSGITNAFVPRFRVNKTSGTLTMTGDFVFAETLTHTAGTVVTTGTNISFYTDNYGASYTLTPNTMQFNNVSFISGNSNYTLTGTMTINGNLTLARQYCDNPRGINTGTLAVHGNISINTCGYNGTAILQSVGANNTTLSINAGALIPTGTVTVNKTNSSNTLTLLNPTNFSGASKAMTITRGIVDMNAQNLTVAGTLTVAANGSLYCNGGTLTTGTLTITGAGVVDCPGVGFSWTGAISSSWNVNGNWSGGAVPGSTRTAVFGSQCSGGNCNATVNVDPGVRRILMRSTYNGTITQAANMTIGTSGFEQQSGTFNGSGNDFNVSAGPFILSGGTFNLGALSTTDYFGVFTQTGGTFNVDSSTLYIDGTTNLTGGTLNGGNQSLYFAAVNTTIGSSHNLNLGASSTVNAIGQSYAYNYFSANGKTFSNFLLGNDCREVDFSGGTITVTGSLTINDSGNSCGAYSFNNGNIISQGDITVLNSGFEGNAILTLSGTSNQTYTGSVADGIVPNLVIAKTGGALTVVNNITVMNNFTYTSGTVNWGSTYLRIAPYGYGTSQIVPGNLVYNDVVFSSYGNYFNLNGGTMQIAGDLSMGSYYNNSNTFDNGVLLLSGDLNINDYGYGGTVIVRLTGTANQLVTGVVAARVPNLEINKTGGVATFTGIITVAGNFTHSNGSADWTTNSTTLRFAESYGTGLITPSNINYFNVWFNSYQRNFDLLTNTMNVTGTLTLEGFSSPGNDAIYNGTINLTGNLETKSVGYGGDAVVKLSGSGNQSITGTIGTYDYRAIPALEIDKTGGVATVTGEIRVQNDFSHTNGNVDWITNSSTLVLQHAYNSRDYIGGNEDYFNLHIWHYATDSDLNASTFNVYGDFTIEETYGTWYPLNNGTINAFGDVAILSYGKPGDAVINILGSANQAYYGELNSSQVPGLAINKSGGTLTYLGTVVTSDYTYTAGNTDWGTSTLIMNEDGTLNAGSDLYNNVTFYCWNYGGDFNLNGSTLNVQGLLTIKDPYDDWYTVNNGNIEAYGNILIENFGLAGNSILKVVGSNNQTFTGVAGYAPLMNIEINKSGGTLTFVNTITAGQNYTHTAGNVDWTTNNATLYIANQSVITPSTVNYNNVTFNMYDKNTDLNAGTMNILGLLKLGSSYDNNRQINNGNLDAYGNVVVDDYGYLGSAQIRMRGGSAQSISNVNNYGIPSSSLIVNKTANSVTQNHNMNLATLDVQSGGYLQNGRNLTLTSLSLNGNTLTKGGGVLTVNSVVQGTGSLFGGTVAP